MLIFSCPLTSELMVHGPSSFTVLGGTDTIGLWTWTESHHQLSWFSRWWVIGLCCQFCVSQVLQKCLSQSLLKFFLKFPCGPVVRIRHFHCHGLDLIPDQGTKILRAMWHPSCPIFFFLYTHTYMCIYIYIYSSYWFLFFWRTLTMQSHHANPSAAHLGGRGEDGAHPSRSDGQSWAS